MLALAGHRPVGARSRPARRSRSSRSPACWTNKVAKRNSTYPVQNAATIEGVEIQNANGESCGGSLEISFAHSCNSVFAPLGAKLGAEKLVETAAEVRLQRGPGLIAARRARRSPPPSEIGDDLAVGSSAIGQGKVLATPLQMALVARHDRRRRRPPHARRCSRAPTRSACARRPPSVARTIKSYMRTVVTDGTGGAAALDGVKVSGKTGTAELRTTVKEEPPPEVTDPNAAAAEDDTTDTDAWFAAFAPLQQADGRGRGAARRPGRGRRHGRAARPAPSSRPALVVEVEVD